MFGKNGQLPMTLFGQKISKWSCSTQKVSSYLHLSLWCIEFVHFKSSRINGGCNGTLGSRGKYLSSFFVDSLPGTTHCTIPDFITTGGSRRWSGAGTHKLLESCLNSRRHFVPEDVGGEKRDDQGKNEDEGWYLPDCLACRQSLENRNRRRA